ncbi:MAG TPA: hypothetical protein VEL51_12505 [Vicinamibacterales bacterium]|nr:hypothetical protein [Vicinamibacterales bacterium]
MVRTVLAGVIALAFAAIVVSVGGDRWLQADPQAAGLTASGMPGAWAGDARIAVNWTTQRELPVRLTIEPDGRVSGTIGDAVLRNGHLGPNRTAIGRALHVKTDWIIRGDLEGAVIKAEGVQRASVSVPLNWFEDHFEGAVHTSGGKFGGKESMWLAAFGLRLDRVKVRQ